MKEEGHYGNMNSGFIHVWRKIREHPIYEPKRPRTKYEAWEDILMEAQFDQKTHEVYFGMSVVFCHRGECVHSIRTWAKRWIWTKGRAERFLKLLAKCDMIEIKTETLTTRIKVCNYDKYMGSQSITETLSGHKWDTNGTRTGHERDNSKKVNNVNNVKNGEETPTLSLSGEPDVKRPKTPNPLPDYTELFEDFWQKCPRIGRTRGKKKKAFIFWCKLVARAKSKLNTEKHVHTYLIERLDIWKDSNQWIKNQGDYIPAIERWLVNDQFREDPD